MDAITSGTSISINCLTYFAKCVKSPQQVEFQIDILPSHYWHNIICCYITTPISRHPPPCLPHTKLHHHHPSPPNQCRHFWQTLENNSLQLLFLYIATQVNPLWPGDTIWWHRSGCTLAQVIAYFLMALSHYLYQCWLLIIKAQW